MDDPTPPEPVALPPGVHVERVVRDDGRQLLLYTWDEPGDEPGDEPRGEA